MGGNVLANLLGVEGKDSLIEAACIIQSPLKFDVDKVKRSLFGLYDF